MKDCLEVKKYTIPVPIWLDCDTGHDDAFAILLGARHPDVDLLGISTVYGNAPLEQTTYNSRAILKAIGRENVPIYAGAAKPFCREVVHAADIHGESGLDGTTVLPVPKVDAKTDKNAFAAMYEALIATPKGTAWFVPTGPLTNAAYLFATYPDLVDHIAGLSIMGGAIGQGFTDAPMGAVGGDTARIGNTTAWAEFNIYIDPESAKSILSNPVLASKTTLITLDLTHQFLATKDVQDLLLGRSVISIPNDQSPPSNVRKLFVEILTFFAKTYADVFGITAGPPVHDVLALAAAFKPDLFYESADSHETKERYAVNVITEGAHADASAQEKERSQCGRTIITPVGTHGIRIPKAVDVEKMWQMINQCLADAEKSSH